MAALGKMDALLADVSGSTAQVPSAPTTVAPPAAKAEPSSAAARKGGGAKAPTPAAKGANGASSQGAPAPPAAAASSAAAKAPDDPAAAAELARKLEVVLSVGEECQTVDDLKNLLLKKPNFTCYDGFEPSGRMHIAQGLYKAINVNKLTSVGGTFVFWVADWFALMNDKMGGDLHKIQTVGKYLIEVWKAAGMDMERVKFLWCADEISSKAASYWPKMLDIARCFDLDRIKKCCMIMARAENKLSGAQILYPLMQCTDIFFLRADVCQLGVDQRKVNMLARDYCGKVGIKLKPVILSHHMLFGLKAGQQKMSKSDVDSAIFMEDSAADVERKLMQAHCPRELPAESIVEADGAAGAGAEADPMHLVKDALQNPCLDYVKHVILSAPGATFKVGERTYMDAADVRADFLAGEISEQQLKRALVDAVNKVLQPVRAHFENDAAARELLAQVRQFSKEPAPPTLRRLALLSAADRACVVCAPLLRAHVSLGAVIATARRLQAAPAECTPVLWVRDWSAIALDCYGGQSKAIGAAYGVLVAALDALYPSLLARTRVLYQSEAILCDPSNYWISAIDAGRRFSLAQLTPLESAPDNEQAGFVVKALMHVADMLALCPTHVRCERAEEPLAAFSEAYRAAHAADLPAAHVGAVETCSLQLRDVPVAGGPGADAECEYTVLDSATSDAGSKMKKAFCALGNVERNPPLRIAQELLRDGHVLAVKRKPADGGDIEYSDAALLEADFAESKLHPGDLKPAVVALVQAALGKIQARLKATPEAKKAETDLRTALKALAKGK
ncbi:hypothetical protein KFE25_013466 [Diacronema lutheri]|uniref:tyrosine--tRNA ligase n=2 Tax=Diacronema lutheri TaxID=2081491 RepID=A0A8J6CI31_DIALT|nr:hypothetical protein KFE25_013466 [Diacronema lutheri]